MLMIVSDIHLDGKDCLIGNIEGMASETSSKTGNAVNQFMNQSRVLSKD